MSATVLGLTETSRKGTFAPGTNSFELTSVDSLEITGSFFG